MTRNPSVFVVGCPRSGTTLLQRMLDHHPLLAVSNDPHFIPFAIEGVREGLDPPVTPALVDWLLAYRTFARLGLREDAVHTAAAKAETYSQFVSKLYSEFAHLHGKPFGGEKTPRYVRFLPLLHSLFPWARTVHVIRDGRDVALSTLDWARADRGPGRLRLWLDQPVAVCALSWRWHVTTGMRDGMSLGRTHYHEVRYEELVAEPQPILRELAAFLHLPYAPEMLEYHRGRTRTEPGLSAKSVWLPPTPGLRDWRRDMARRDLELFEAIAGDLLTLLGYERACDAVADEVDELARSCRDAWEAEMRERKPRLASRADLSLDLELLAGAR
jgi:hypothetical protein